MYKKYNRFLKIKIKKKRKENKKRKTPKSCKSPTQEQRFITTIKNVTEEKEKESSKAQLDFLAPIQLTTTTERGGGGKGKNNPKESIEQVKK